MAPPHWVSSLRFRLLAATLVGIVLALLLAGFALADLFRDHVTRQFQASLAQQLDQLTARLEFGAAGEPVLDGRTLSDPRWQKPYSGLYWQIDGIGRSGVLRSRSLWDTTLQLQTDALAHGGLHVHRGTGPLGVPVLMLERSVQSSDDPQTVWRLIVAADTQALEEAVGGFAGVLAASLAVLLALLVLAALAQVGVGLSPLRALQRSLAAVREGREQRLEGNFPAEVQPLIDDFNSVLERNAEVAARARTHAGNLAHAIKTPLAVLGQAAGQALKQAPVPLDAAAAPVGALARLVQEQVDVARRQVDWHLARARAAAALRMPGLRTPLAPVVAGLIRVMRRVHAGRGLTIASEELPGTWAFSGEEQDLQEMLGNILDNACKWARTTVKVSAALVPSPLPPRLCVCIEDDGPGIEASRRAAVMARGVRIDESVPGSGLGLAIVAELVQIYGGDIELQTSALGGVRVQIHLPAAG
ncbi:sensor histidine kinase [Ramlibacter sp. H39-3-26]|nr:sensor histidine kinase [Ramlibacter sp. H39-3-26]MDF1486444.1 sensor histidine kinase [Ramlibacter sp. H39-3-26]